MTPLIAITGAYGATGEVVVNELLRTTPADLRIGGRDLTRAAGLAARAPGRIEARRLDVLDGASLAAFCEGARIVINCAGPTFTVLDRVARAALRCGSHYIDPGGYENVAAALADVTDDAAKRELSLVLSAGWMPGLSELLVHYADELARERMAEISTVRLYYGDTSDWSDIGTQDIIWHARHSKDSIGAFRRGRWIRRSTLTSSHSVELPGRRTRVYMHFPHQLRSFAASRSYEEISCHVSSFGTRSALVMMAIQAFVRDEATAVRMVRRERARDAAVRGLGGELVVRIEGRRATGQRVRMEVLVREDRGYWITGLVPALVARAILDGQPPRPGVRFLCDAVAPRPFWESVQREGVRCTVEETQLPGPPSGRLFGG